jgi:carbon monoxide dehydrogenase subunit G
MKIDKQFTVDASQQAVWDFITSPDKVAPCIPGCDDVEAIGPGKYRAAIKLEAGPIKTTFHLTVTATEERPPEYCSYQTQGEEGGKASRLSATSSLTIVPLGEHQCEVSYASEITIAGRLGKFGAGVMKKIADKMSDKFVTALRAEIAGNSV